MLGQRPLTTPRSARAVDRFYKEEEDSPLSQTDGSHVSKEKWGEEKRDGARGD